MRTIDYITVGLSILAVLWFLYMVSSGHRARHEEDAARAFFDEHGRWPDEDPRSG
jgi:hypothetical protein